MLVVSVRMKSSAVSVSRWRMLTGWDSAPSSPSGAPVLKKNGSAQAGVASPTPAVTVAATSRRPAGTSAGIRVAKNVNNLVVVRDRFMKSSYWVVWVKGCREPEEAARLERAEAAGGDRPPQPREENRTVVPSGSSTALVQRS